MDPYSSGEDLVVKTRKPYTITKQRERWTEDEHNRFLEALKLYGRAWQRIEEYIGTKTAVQIRSHAQKFFTKLEKEAITKGIPVGHTLDIEIPPPRPKKKPSNPYPRKTSVASPSSKNGKISSLEPSSRQARSTLGLDKQPQLTFEDRNLGIDETSIEKDDCSKVFILSKTAPCASSLSANKRASSPQKSCISKDLPLSKEARNKEDETTPSSLSDEAKGLEEDISENRLLFQENNSSHVSSIMRPICGERVDEPKQLSETSEIVRTTDVQTSQNCPRHVPVHILDQNLGMTAQNITESLFGNMGGVTGPKSLFTIAAAAASSKQQTTASCSSFHPPFPCYHPMLNPVQNQDDYRSFLHASSTFSSLVVSALSQNAAAHAVASFSATVWPYANVEASAEPLGAIAEAFQSGRINSAPSVAAIAAATVAAATAWWAAHGLLPLGAPFHPIFPCSPPTASTTPIDRQAKVLTNEKRESNLDADLGDQQLEPECTKALHELHSTLKSPTVSSSDSEGSQGAGIPASETTQLPDGAHKSKNRKQVDRSSCGSNTPSSSEVEADTLEKHNKEEEEQHMKDKEKELEAIHYAHDPFGLHYRSNCTVNDPRKEVSEEGRMAFNALFSREVLPQSFSPPHDLKNDGKDTNVGKIKADANDKDRLQFDLNRKTCETFSQKQELEESVSLISLNKEDAPLKMGLGHAKLQARRMGFKPYKRCSMEAKDSRVLANCQDEEKGSKRLRLEREASN